MAITEKELLEIKDDITEAEKELISIEAETRVLKKQLKDDWDCDSLAEAKKKILSLKDSITEINKEITEKSEELEEIL